MMPENAPDGLLGGDQANPDGSASDALLTPDDELAFVDLRLSDSSVIRPVAAGKPLYAPLATGEEVIGLVSQKPKDILFSLAGLLHIHNTATLNWADAAKKFEPDELLSRHLLGYISQSGLAGCQVDSVARAVSLLTVPKVLEIGEAIAFVLWSSRYRLDKAEKLRPKHYLRHVLVTAAVAKILAEELPGLRVRPEEAYGTALMLKVGVMALQLRFPELYSAILTRQRGSEEPLHVLERRVLQTDHAEVGAHLMEIWQLPGSMVEAVRDHLHDDAEDSLCDLTGLCMVACQTTTAVGLGVVKKQEKTEPGLAMRDFLRRTRSQWARGDVHAQLSMYFGERIGLRDADARQILSYIEIAEDMRFVDTDTPEKVEEPEAAPPVEEEPRAAAPVGLAPKVVRKARPRRDPKPTDIDDTPLLTSLPSASSSAELSVTEFLVPGLANMRRGSPAIGRTQLVGFCSFTLGGMAVAPASAPFATLFLLGMMLMVLWSLLSFPRDHT